MKTLGYWSPYKGTTYYTHILWLSYLIHVLCCMYSTEMYAYCRRIIAFQVCYMLSGMLPVSFLLPFELNTRSIFFYYLHMTCYVCVYYVKGRVIVLVLIRQCVCVCDLDRSVVLLHLGVALVNKNIIL